MTPSSQALASAARPLGPSGLHQSTGLGGLGQELGDLAEAAEITQPAWHRRGLRARGLEAIGWAARRLL